MRSMRWNYLQEVFDWPNRVLDKVCANHVRAHALRSFLSAGCVVGSDYSGVGGEKEILIQLSAAMDMKGWPMPQQKHRPRFRFHRACDCDHLPQQALLYWAMHHDMGQSCVFSDINDRLPPQTRERLDALMPSQDEEKTEAAIKFQKMSKWLFTNRGWLFTDFTKAWCLAHKKFCPSYAGIDDDVPEVERPLQVNFAGNTCKGWSSVGGKQFFGHSSERPHAIWLAERAARAEAGGESMFFEDCTVLYPFKEKLRAPLSKSHRLVRIITGPEKQGFPSQRPPQLDSRLGLEPSSVAWAYYRQRDPGRV